MGYHRSQLAFFLFVALIAPSTPLHAALLSRANGQAIYDTDRDITWVADADLADTLNFGVSIYHIGSGKTTDLATALAWITAMNGANYLGANNWRLPTTLQPDSGCGSVSGGSGIWAAASEGFNCTGSELGHMFYTELNGTALYPAHGYNIQQNGYWSWNVGSKVWVFDMSSGYQGAAGVVTSPSTACCATAWAVRTGDILAVPVPSTVLLLGSGMIGLIGFGPYRRSRKCRI